MEQINDFRELAFKKELDEAILKIQNTLIEDYAVDDDCPEEDIWGTNNKIEVDNIPDLFRDLQNELLPTNLDLHYTIPHNEASYDEANSRFILMDDLKPVFIIWFYDVIASKKGYYEGLKKDGIREIIKAALNYHHYQKDLTTK